MPTFGHLISKMQIFASIFFHPPICQAKNFRGSFVSKTRWGVQPCISVQAAPGGLRQKSSAPLSPLLENVNTVLASKYATMCQSGQHVKETLVGPLPGATWACNKRKEQMVWKGQKVANFHKVLHFWSRVECHLFPLRYMFELASCARVMQKTVHFFVKYTNTQIIPNHHK